MLVMFSVEENMSGYFIFQCGFVSKGFCSEIKQAVYLIY